MNEVKTRKRTTLYVSDMDGTLLNGESRVSPRSAEILNSLVDRGVMFTVATARTPATVQPLMEQVKQSFYTSPSGERLPLPAIVMTGAGLWNRLTARFESCATLPQADAEMVRDLFEREGIHPFVYCLSGDTFLNVYHTSAMTSRERNFYQERRHLSGKRFHLDQRPSRWDSVALFFAIGPVDAIERMTAELHGRTPCAAAWYRDLFIPDTGCIDIYAPGVSKATAVEQMARTVGATEVVVFGDNLNDLPMMRVADIAVATENALPEVKAAAHTVIGLNTDDAVARWIQEREERKEREER